MVVSNILQYSYSNLLPNTNKLGKNHLFTIENSEILSYLDFHCR